MRYSTPATAFALTQAPSDPRPAFEGFYDHAIARFVGRIDDGKDWAPCQLPTPAEARAAFDRMREDRKLDPGVRPIYMHPAEVADLLDGPI